MNKLTLIFVVGAVLFAAAPIAYADETKADCEPGQKWIGYSDTDSARATYNSVMDNLGGVPRVNNCEGEQWDGQDQVSSQPSQGWNGVAECAPGQSGLTDTSPTATRDVNLCMSNDLNADTSGNAPTATPLGIRVSTDGSRVYVGTNIRFVGDAVVYQSVNTDGTIATTGVYLRDNTNDAVGTNVLATIVSAARLTKGKVGEADCTQDQYNQSAQDPSHPTCARDNTAVTLEILS